MTDLSDKMRTLATGHPRGSELIELADAFDQATAGFYGEPQTVDVKTFVGRWARARRVYSEVTGEPLV